MKKIILIFIALSLTLIFSCSKDESAPVIMLKGESAINHVLNDEFVEPGYAAFDDEDGDITDKVTVGSLKENEAGEQTITYSVADTEGNNGEAKRKVIVFNEADIMQGSWNAEYIFPYPSADKAQYTDNITTSDKINREFTISDFGENIGANIIGTMGTTSLSFEDQTISGDAFSVQQVNIADNSTKITIEYTIGSDVGVMVLVKNN